MVSRGFLVHLIALLAALAGAPETARAAASAWAETEHGALRLITAGDSAGQSDRIAAGFHFRMKPGWKIYWRSPGDAGFPPSPDWAGSDNLAEARLAWPAPSRFDVQGLQTLGYKDEVVLPVVVSPEVPGQAVALRAKVSYLTCDDICVPYEATLALDLPAQSARPGGDTLTTREAGLIQRFAARVPATAGGPLALLSAETTEVGSHGELRLRIAVNAPAPSDAGPLYPGSRAPAGLVKPDAFVEGPPALSFGPAHAEIAEDGRTALLKVAVVAPPGKPLGLAGESVTVTVIDGSRAIERSLNVVRAVPVRGDAAGETMPEWLTILGLAVLGGLILNLMPCVLPVLSIKLLSVLGHGGGAAREVRRGFLASAAGIVASFFALATGAVALRAAGKAAGWGLQFQEPAFLAAMVFILVLFAANLWGRFEFRLPGTVADFAGTAGTGNGALTGHFLSGAFATLLATPCSAPFLGTAVGFALARGPLEIYGVFAALGVGLALPYLLIAAVPSLATALPRPGAWMVKLKRVLSLALVATAIWLLAVLAAQSGLVVAGLVAVMLVVAGVALWPLPQAGLRMRIASWVSVGALGILAVGAVIALPSLAPRATEGGAALFGSKTGVSADARKAGGEWRPFARDAIDREVAAGRVVFVDVTADWCVTCKVNKAIVLDRDEVQDLLRSPGVVAMRADWTRPDPAIAEYLKGFGRYGIPFNAVYGPATPSGTALPELLTVSAVRDAFAAARGASHPDPEQASRVSKRR